MALIRPVVLVFQEFASPTVTPTTPDLNCLVVGPAYFIQDYFKPGTTTYADKSDILLTAEYGILEDDPGEATPVGDAVITAANAPNNAVGALVDEDSVVVYFDEARVEIASGTAGTTAAATPNQFDVSDSVDFTTGVDKVVPGDRVLVMDSGSNVIARTVRTVDTATRLHFTADIPASGFTAGGSQDWRIERQLNDKPIDSSFYAANGNVITVDGGVTLAVAGQGAKTVTYAKVYVEYRSLRQDLGVLDTVSSTDDILAKLGRLDARNPLAVGAFVARQNTTSSVQFIGVLSNDLEGHSSARDSIAARSDVYAVCPLTADVSVLAMWNSDCVGLSLPDEAQGRPQRFRVVIGSGTLPVTKTLAEPSATGKTEALSGSAPATVTKLTASTLNFITSGVVPGDILHITVDAAGTTRVGSYTIAAVVSATILEIDEAVPFPSAATANATLNIKESDDTAVRIASGAVTGVVTAASADLFLILRDANATFITSGVAAGDVIEMPANPEDDDFDGALSQFVVETVLSENRLQIVNNSQDSSSVQNELPHGVKRAGGALVPTTAILNYQVVRTLTKDGQVTDLVALAQSFRSRRTVLVWPDQVNVAGVTGGAAQPGYFLACAVGGMTAGLPPHQGFTFLGIAGVSQIFHSNTYFKDEQLTDLSNGGWYVFAQQTTTSLPYTIHQLTTDVTTLETGEFSVVKNFDFVSLFFVDILEEFLGVYNVNTDTLVLVRSALNIGGESLKLRTYAKIGAPLTSFAIADLGVSALSGDRVVTHLNIGLPKPLNVVELHLVAA